MNHNRFPRLNNLLDRLLGLFLAFIKFYRRYSEEAVLAFVTIDETLMRRE
jgi:hypothetical protein